MGTVLRTSTPGPRVQQAPLPVVDAAPEEDPDEVAMRSEIARLEASLGQPQKAMYTPEQIQQRRTMNEADTQFGMLGMLSGQQNLSEAGGMLFKNALAQAQPRVTEHGVADGITGEFSYNPGYLDEKTRNKLDSLRILKLTLGAKATAAAKAQQTQRDVGAGHDAARVAAGGGGEVGTGTTVSPYADSTGKPLLKDKQGRLIGYNDQGQPEVHAGPVTTKPAGGPPKLPAEIARMNIAFKALNSTIDEYLTQLETFDPQSIDQLDPQKRADIAALQSRITIEAKEAAALGALTGPDLEIVGNMLSSPTSLKAMMYGKGGLQAQSQQMRNWIAARRKAVEEQYPMPAVPATLGKPGDKEPRGEVDFNTLKSRRP